MTPLSTGQVWRKIAGPDYGDINRWKVAAIGKRVAAIENMATMQSAAVLAAELPEFIIHFELETQP